MVTAFYSDAEAAVHMLRHTETLLAEHAWIQRQADSRGITVDSVRRKLKSWLANNEKYLAERATAVGMTPTGYRQAVERKMKRMQLAEGYDFLLPSESPSEEGAPAQRVVPACEWGPRFLSAHSTALVVVRGDRVTSAFTADHYTDRPADHDIDLTWNHDQGPGPRGGRASPSRRQLSICRNYASAGHAVTWDRCDVNSPATATARGLHVTSDLRYGGNTFTTRASSDSDRASVSRRGCGGGGSGTEGSPPYVRDVLCDSGYRTSTGDCCDSMVVIDGAPWCVVVR